jgi:ABC-type sugar transport system ATPase subunit
MRPEHVQEGAATWQLEGRVAATELLGSDLLVYVDIDAEPVLTAEVIEVAADIDASSVDELHAEAAASRTPVVCRFGAGSRIRIDDTITIGFSPDQVHFFDLGTGSAIRQA